MQTCHSCAKKLAERRVAVSEVAALLERQHDEPEVREVIDEVEDSNVQAAKVVGEAGEGASWSYTQNRDPGPEHLRHGVSYSLSSSGKLVENTTKVSISAARRQHIMECFDEILDVAASPTGVHHIMAAIIEEIFVEVEKLSKDIGKH